MKLYQDIKYFILDPSLWYFKYKVWLNFGWKLIKIDYSELRSTETASEATLCWEGIADEKHDM